MANNNTSDTRRLPQPIGMGRLFTAWAICLVLIFCIWVWTRWYIWLPIDALTIWYFSKGTIKSPPNTIRAITHFGKLVTDVQIDSQTTFLWPGIENAPEEFIYPKKWIPVDFEFDGLSSDNWRVFQKGFTMIRPLDAPKLSKVFNGLQTVGKNIRTMVVEAALDPFGERKAANIDENKTEFVGTIRENIEREMKAESSVDDDEKILVKLGIEVGDIQLSDPVIQKEFFDYVSKVSRAEIDGDALIATSLKVAGAIKAISPSLGTSDRANELALAAVERQQGKRNTNQTIFTLDDTHGLAGAFVETVGKKLGQGLEKLLGMIDDTEKSVPKGNSKKK